MGRSSETTSMNSAAPTSEFIGSYLQKKEKNLSETAKRYSLPMAEQSFSNNTSHIISYLAHYVP